MGRLGSPQRRRSKNRNMRKASGGNSLTEPCALTVRRCPMITLPEFLGIISLAITAFSLGYRLGRDKRNDVTDSKTRK